jgi:nitroreductase
MNISTPVIAPKTEALNRRYGADATPKAGPWNAHLDLLLSHRSIRGYRSDPLPEGTLETLIAAAQSAASSSNLQLWSAVVVRDQATKVELAKIAGDQKHIEQCPLFLVWLADLSRNERVAGEAKVMLEAPPHFETFLVAAVDAALAAQNAVTAAESLDLSTVYIGAMRNDPLRVKELLGLPDQTMAVFGLCVGYAAADTDNEVKPRLPQPAVVFSEKYGNPEEPDLRAAYDELMMTFSDRQGMGAVSWSRRVLDRLGPLKSMNGRETLAATLKAMGFPLR